MPRISKKTLLQDAVEAIRSAGWEVAVLSKAGQHPMRLRMRRGTTDIITCVYIWAVSHGGGRARPSHEHRIQITSDVAQFRLEDGEKTLVLGWSSKFGVYAAFDVTRHAGRLGSSPSMQIGQAALLRAGEVGAAMHMRRRDEVAIAVRPDLLGDYVERLELLHNKASAARQIEELRRALDPAPEADVLVSEEAQRALVELEAGRKPRFGDLNEIAQRQTIIERLAAIEERLSALAPAKIGHNQPPEPIEADQVSPILEARDASRTIAVEVAKAKPDVAEVARRTTILAGMARKLRAAGGGVADFGKRVKDKAHDKAAEIVATAVVGGGAALHQQIGSALSSITNWFKMLF
ncbi:hypothetical protein [Roseococcus microcysteis]|uniref:hypothetical protein n=1 Tax=Roseococcus microcysteis TaxID=2771361 RepID=UPI00168ACB8F|nr:hypothetical protein [Roseococcus microcysteis]